jgi:syntaxin-binding protein 1
LYIVDRSLDLYAPLLHEFTYQAMAMDLLPVRDGDKTLYKTIIHEGEENQEEKDMEINEKDKLWVAYRHRHMKDTIAGMMDDFQKFLKDNPHFANSNADTTNINTIKTMLAGLPQFQEMKESYSLHLNMATTSMDIFQKHQLSELASLEQILATGLDEDYKKPRNVVDQTIRMLDEDAVVPPDRLRLIAMYMLYRDGLLPSDITLLRSHAKLPPQDEEVLRNMEILGARVNRKIGDAKTVPVTPPLFPTKIPGAQEEDDSFLSRYDPNLKKVLENHVAGTLDPIAFPYTRPDPSQHAGPDPALAAGSLRSAKPTWAKTKLSSIEPRQRVLVFMAGGATYSEARACYEITNQTSRDVVLITSHMLTPGLWMRQLGDLSQDRRRLGIPADQQPKVAPKHLFEEERPPPPPVKSPQPSVGSTHTPSGSTASFKPPQGTAVPPTQAMQNLRVNGSGGSSNHSRPGSNASPGIIKLGGDGGEEKEKKKKKHHFGFGSSKK